MPDSTDGDPIDRLATESPVHRTRWIRVGLASDHGDRHFLIRFLRLCQVPAKLGEQLSGGFRVREVGAIDEEDSGQGRSRRQVSGAKELRK